MADKMFEMLGVPGKIKGLVLLGVLSLLLAGCSGGSDESVPAPVSSSKIRNLAPIASVSTQAAVVNGSNSLGLDLLGSTQENAVVAPFSAALSLARLRAGAKGETLAAINGVMHLNGVGADDLDAVFNHLDLGISARIGTASLGAQASEAVAGGWAQAGYGYLLTYLDTLAENYGLKPSRLDFAGAWGDAEQTVQDWGSPAAVTTTQDTRLVLGDLVRLNAAWVEPFDLALTETGGFQLSGLSVVQVPFMRKTALLPWASGDGYVALALTVGGTQQLLVVLPDDGRFTEIQSSLTAKRLQQIVGTLTPAPVNLALPKFTVASTLPINVGSASARGSADFSGMDGTRDLYVAATLHQARLAVTEAGLQASATTLLTLDDRQPETWPDPNGSIGVILTSDAFSPLDVILGRPFIFAVRDSLTGAILFMGRVMDPRA